MVTFPFAAVREIVKSETPSNEAIQIVLDYARRFEHALMRKEALNIRSFFVDNPDVVQAIPPEAWRELRKKYGDTS